MKKQSQGQPPAPQYQNTKRNNFTGLASNPNRNVMSNMQQQGSVYGSLNNMANANQGMANVGQAMSMANPNQARANASQSMAQDQKGQQAQQMQQMQQANAIRQQPAVDRAATAQMNQRNEGDNMAAAAQSMASGNKGMNQQTAAQKARSPMANAMWEKALSTPEAQEQMNAWASANSNDPRAQAFQNIK